MRSTQLARGWSSWHAHVGERRYAFQQLRWAASRWHKLGLRLAYAGWVGVWRSAWRWADDRSRLNDRSIERERD